MNIAEGMNDSTAFMPTATTFKALPLPAKNRTWTEWASQKWVNFWGTPALPSQAKETTPLLAAQITTAINSG
jgi:hypothetical protein